MNTLQFSKTENSENQDIYAFTTPNFSTNIIFDREDTKDTCYDEMIYPLQDL